MIAGGVEVRMAGEPTMQTTKLTLVLAVAFVAMAAARTSFACVRGVDGNNRHTCKSRLVLDEAAELKECPSGMSSSSSPPNRYSRSNVLEVFKRNTPRCAFSDGNELFTDDVVHVSAESRFTPTDALHNAFTGTGAFLLEFPASLSEPSPDFLNLFAAIDFSVAIHGEIDDAQINAKEVVNFDGRGLLKFDGAVQEELAIPIDEIALSTNTGEISRLILAEDVGDHQPASADSQDANTVAVLERQDSFIVGHRSRRTEYGAFCLVAGETLSGLADGANGHLCRQIPAITAFSISELLNRRSREDAGSESLFGSKGSRLVIAAHGVEQDFALFDRRQQFQLES